MRLPRILPQRLPKSLFRRSRTQCPTLATLRVPTPATIARAPPPVPSKTSATTVRAPILGPGDVTSTDTGDDTDAAEDTNDDTVEDTADADDNVTKDEIVDIDDVVDEDREDQKAGKKDKDDDDEDREDQKADKKDKDDDEDDNEDKDGVEQSGDQDADSGDVDQDANVINTGDNVNQCVAILQVANTGNAQNANQIAQSDSEAGEIELEDGSTINITPG